MLMALETGTVDFVCTDMPTPAGAVRAYPDLKILDSLELTAIFSSLMKSVPKM